MTTVDAEALVQIADEREDLVAGVRVEVAGRLVGQDDRRVDRQRARDGHPLALAAGQLVRQVIQAMAELDERQQFAGAFVDLLTRPAAQVQRQADVLETA